MEHSNKLTLLDIALQNLKKQSFRTGFMIFFIMLQSVTLLFSSILMSNMERGIQNTVERVGADLIVIPEGESGNLQQSLFMGKACTLYFDKEWIEKIALFEGVQRVSPQRYIETQQTSCCDLAVQLIAIDPASDFTIQPWIQQSGDIEPTGEEIVVGANVQAFPGDTMKFYNLDFTVKARLEKTGMGYDNSVFMTMDTSNRLFSSKNAIQYLDLDRHPDSISMINVDVKEGYNIEEVARKMRLAYKDSPIDIYTANRLFGTILENVKKFSSYTAIINVLLFFSTSLALICIFEITIHERKKEFGILYTVGARKKQIASLITSEAMIISSIGCLIGIFLTAGVLTATKIPISMRFDIPYFEIWEKDTYLSILRCLILSLLTGIAASVYSVWKISKEEPYALLKENE